MGLREELIRAQDEGRRQKEQAAEKERRAGMSCVGEGGGAKLERKRGGRETDNFRSRFPLERAKK